MGKKKHNNSMNPRVQLRMADAITAFQAGNYGLALKKTDALLKILPTSPDLIKLRGLIDLNQGDFQAASERFRHGLSLNPTNTAFSELLGTAFLELGRYDEAISSFRRVLLVDSRNPATLNNLGAALRQVGDLVKAEKAFRDSLIFRPDHVSTHLNLGDTLLKQDKFEEAEDIYAQLVGDQPELTEAYQALADCQMQARKWQEVLTTIELASEKVTIDAELITLKGTALGAMMRFEDAEAVLLTSLEIEPDRPSTQMALSIISFYQQNWKQAWSYYESRWNCPPYLERPFKQTVWSGEDLTGKSILLWGEQGVGDEVLFASQLPELMHKTSQITFEMDERLVPLFQRSFRTVKCVARLEARSPTLTEGNFDYQCPTGSLGLPLRTVEADFGLGGAYLEPDPIKVELLRKRYQDCDKKLTVGLAWYSSDQRGLSKSIPLVKLSALFELTGIQFVNLQYGDTKDQREVVNASSASELLHDETIDQMKSLDDFAAQIASLDLVISISNTTVHLAGALGVPTWVLLSAAPMQRWLIDRSDSPWYASIELIRQRKKDDWEYVVEEVKQRLIKRLGPQNS